eukprot:14726103-Alexandrium_andersonii.AAC.1
MLSLLGAPEPWASRRPLEARTKHPGPPPSNACKGLGEGPNSGSRARARAGGTSPTDDTQRP